MLHPGASDGDDALGSADDVLAEVADGLDAEVSGGVGCGLGEEVVQLADRGHGLDYVGLDLDAEDLAELLPQRAKTVDGDVEVAGLGEDLSCSLGGLEAVFKLPRGRRARRRRRRCSCSGTRARDRGTRGVTSAAWERAGRYVR